MGPEFRIITWPTRTFWTPRVAWNSFRNEYLVVWNALDAATLVPNDIAFVILSATGDRLHETIITSAGEPHQVDVTYNFASDEYLVVWRHMYAPGDGDIRGARIRGSDGAVVTPPGIFTIDAEPEDQMLPAVATNQQHRYLVVWQHAFPGPCCDWDIRGRELDVNGGLLGSPIIFASSTDDEIKPAVAAKRGILGAYWIVLFFFHYRPLMK